MTTLVKEGRAEAMICEVAINVDAIIFATHGITVLKHHMVGSVSGVR